MQLLQDIAQFSNFEQPKGGNLLKLYHLAIEQQIDRSTAARQFKSKSYFRQLYKELKNHLLDGVLLNSFSQLTKTQQAHFNIRKRSLEAKMLFQSGKKDTAITIFKEVFVAAKRHELALIALEAGKELAYHYSIVTPNKQKLLRYQASNDQHLRLYTQLCKIERSYNQLGYCIQTRQSTSYFLDELATLKDIAAENEQYFFRLYYYSIQILYAQSKSDQIGILGICEAAILFFRSKVIPVLPYTTLFNFQFQMIPIQLARKKYAATELLINQCQALPTKGSYNWHLTLLYQAVLGFHSNKPLISLRAWQMAHQTKRLFTSVLIEQRWDLVMGYLSLWQQWGQLSAPLPKKFRLRKFLNTSSNIPPSTLLVLELLHLLATGKRAAYMRLCEGIEGQVQRQCKGKGLARTRHFLRMLRAIELGDYHPIRVAAHAKKHRQLLEKVGAGGLVDVLDVEPVRYEVIWGMVGF